MRIELTATVLLALALSGCQTEQASIGQGSTAPAFEGVTFDGARVTFPELLDGRPAVVVFWATWCGYCKAFMPYLEDIQADYGESINVLTINAKEDGSGDPGAYVDDLGFPMIAVSDGDAIAAAYDVEYIPGLMIVDAEGTVAYRRAWTDLPAGDRVARLWSIQVRQGLDELLD